MEEFTTLGSILAAAREAHGLTIEQVAAELRVESRFLDALEEDRHDLFAAPVFVKGYLKHLANRLELDYEDLIARYARQTDTQDAPVTYHEPIREANNLFAPLLIGGLIIVLGIPAFWFTWISGDSLSNILSSEEEPPVAPPAEIEPAPSVTAGPTVPDVTSEPPIAAEPIIAAEPVLAQPLSTDSGPEGAPTPADPSLIETNPEETPLPEGQLPADAAPPESAAPGPATASPADAAGVNQFAGPTIQVAISFEEDCWTEVSDGNGASLYYALGRAGTSASFDGAAPMSFTLGNPLGVQVSINNQPYTLPEPTGNEATVRFIVAEAP